MVGWCLKFNHKKIVLQFFGSVTRGKRGLLEKFPHEKKGKREKKLNVGKLDKVTQ